MELTHQVATLQDEVKLLKGEIKAILKEIRTAVLSRDNPFSVDISPPTFRSVDRRGGTSDGEPAGEREEQQPEAPAPAPSGVDVPQAPPPAAEPSTPSAAPPAAAAAAAATPASSAGGAAASPPPPPAASGGGPWPQAAGPIVSGWPQAMPAPGPVPPSMSSSEAPAAVSGASLPTGRETPQVPGVDVTEPAEAALSPDAGSWERTTPWAVGADAPPFLEPATFRSVGPAAQAAHAEGRDDRQAAPVRSSAPHWNLLTIAGLVAWAEDALTTLGRRRFQLMLELASFAELLPSNVRDVLHGLAEDAPAEEQSDRPMNINECLVVLRQLEAIVQGENVSRLPRRRGARHRRVR